MRERLAAFRCGARRVERSLQHEIRGELHVAALRAQQLGQIIGGESRVERGPFFGPARTGNGVYTHEELHRAKSYAGA